MSNKKYSVLYVDDEEPILRVFKNTFRTQFKIFTCNNGPDALEILKNEEIHLVLTDQRMPEMSGIEFLQECKRIKKDIKCILVTGYSDILTLEEAINKVGVWRYVSKPWSVEYLLSSINDALRVLHLENEKVKSDKELQTTNRRLSLTLQSTEIGLWDWNIINDEIFLDQQYRKLLGYNDDEHKTNFENFFKSVHPDDLHLIKEKYTEIKRHTFDSPALNMEFRIQKADGEYIWALYQGSIIEQINGVASRIVGVVKDISDEKLQKEKELALILATEDKERKRIATELHDGLGQNLTAANLFLEGVKKDLTGLPEEGIDNLNKGMTFLNKAIVESRNIAHNLMPKAINDYGYITSISSLLKSLQDASGTLFSFYHNLGDERLPKEVELGLYRITQEAVNNILKYAKAEKAFIQLIKHETQITLTIEDNGKGFDVNSLNEQNSFGIISMKNRAVSLSGACHVDSTGGKGAIITIQIPYKELKL